VRPSILILCLTAAACSAEVRDGLPPLVTGCSSNADCAVAGPQFQCVQGGCMILSCVCDADCAAAGLLCYSATQANGLQGNQCLATTLGTPCDGG
jgi:hypothetical protein